MYLVSTKMRANKGFTLIEALVALVILAASFAAVWGWINTAVKTTQKIERVMPLPVVFEQFLQHLSLINLETERQGNILVGDYELQWTARELRSSTNEPFRRQPQWQVVLLQIDVNVMFSKQIIAEFSTKKVAQWKVSGQSIDDIFGPR